MNTEKETSKKKTLGQAIDEAINALVPLDEGNRLTAIRAVCENLNIPLIEHEAVTSLSQQTTSTPPYTPAQPPDIPQDIKSLKEQKQPTADTEMAAIVAYFLAEVAPQEERKGTINQEDLQTYFRQAHYPLPKVIRVTLPNAKRAGYFDSAPEAGEYKLNAVGYNLVAHNLPRAPGSTPKKSTTKKATTKKTTKKKPTGKTAKKK